MDIKGKKVVITGASTGIGYDLLVKLLDLGCTVVASSRTIENTDIKRDNLYKYNCNVNTSENIDKLFDYALSVMGSIDIFIANAGFAFYEKIDKPNWEHVEEIYNVNVFSIFYSAEKMKSLYYDKPYNFVVVGSAMGFISLPGYAFYSSTKAALRGFADSYRYELNKDQYFQMVYPIATRTDFFKAAGDIPLSWPVQKSSYVADCIISGIKKNKLNIYPFKLFRVFNVITTLCPPLVKIYNRYNYNNYIKWLEKAKDKGAR